MKEKKLKKIIQKPLRFHHQDIHDELDEIKDELMIIKSMIRQLMKTPQDKG